ncbi:MAG: NAD(P)H-binding protein [Bacteroidota bacterium]
MTILLFGATGMIGHGTLNAALADDRVTRVVSVARRSTGRQHAKLVEVLHADMTDLSPIIDQLANVDACLFCLGVSSAGMNEADYRRITYDLTHSVATTLVGLNPEMTFVYVSGAGSNARSRQMWARVKGEIENALMALPFGGVYNARPGFIQPVGGARSKTALYRTLYAVMGPVASLIRRVAPNALIDSDELGAALVEAGLAGAPEQILEVSALRLLAERAAPHRAGAMG